jgi:hypothetical protein
MPSWKKILLRSAGFGAGFAVALCGVVGFWIWYGDRPKPPKAWNKEAITAEYDYVRPAGDKNNLVFYYTLQNNTDFDYRIDSDAEIEISSRLRKQKEFGEFAGKKDLTTEYPVFLPARNRVRFFLNIPYAYPVREKSDPTDDQQREYTTEVARYVTKEMSNLDGFVLFDAKNRYEIDFPAGWEKRAKETPVQK